MTPDEWAEVFAAGKVAARYALDRGAGVPAALMAMEEKCTDIAKRHQPSEPRTTEITIFGTPISKITYEDAVRWKGWIGSYDDPQSQFIKRVLDSVIAAGPKEDRNPIEIIPPTVLIQAKKHTLEGNHG